MMKLFHYFSVRRKGHAPQSTWEIGDGEGTCIFHPSGSGVQVLRFLRRNGYQIPDEMIGPQTKNYTVSLQEEA